MFHIQATPTSPKIKIESIPIDLNAIPFTTFATNSTLPSMPSPLTPAPEESHSRPGILLNVNAVWHAMERQEVYPFPQVKQEPSTPLIPIRPVGFKSRPLHIPPTSPPPIFRKMAEPFADLDKVADLYGVPMELSE